MSPFQIVKVEKQIVSGIMYTVTMKLAVTQCLKGVKVEELTGCQENSGNMILNVVNYPDSSNIINNIV